MARHEMETAAQVARKALLNTTEKKRWNNLALALASIYISCRINENVKRLSEIMDEADGSRCTRREITKAFRALSFGLNLHPPSRAEEKTLLTITKNLKTNKDILISANEIIKVSKKAHIGAGKNPGSIATASVYLAYKLKGKKITQRVVCIAAKTSEVTLRSRVKDIIKNLSIVIEV